MDEYLLRLAGGLPGAGMEWFAVFSFFAVAAVYFLAPVLGYQAERRGLLAVALYLLLGYGMLVLLQMVIQYGVYVVNANAANPGRPTFHLLYIFAIFKLLVFVGAQGAFVFGLQGLRRDAAAGK